MNGWKRKELWRKLGRAFCVEVSHHMDDTGERGDGLHRWCVYSYIYPNHALFPEFVGNDIFQDAAMRLPLHGGASYMKWHRDDKGYVSAVQVGADYNHIGDDEYTHMECSEDAKSVFADAEKLASFLAGDFHAVDPKDS